MNLNQLKVFYITAKVLNFSKAAELLCISQPAVSLHIKNLEDVLRVKLFNKVGHRIYLTEPGEILLGYAKKIFELEIEAEHAIKEVAELKKGTLHIGTTKTYARYLMPKFISAFHAKFPNISVTLNEGSSTEMIKSLFTLQNELAIVAHADYPKNIMTIEFAKEEIVFLAKPTHPLCKKDYVTLDDLAKTPIIMREEGSGTRRVIMDTFQERGLIPTILYEASNLDFIKELLIHGEGISYMVKSAVEQEIAQGLLCVLRLKDIKFEMYSKIVFLDEQSLSRAARAFIDILLKKNSSNNLNETKDKN